jgi:hypothetical protein
MKRESKLYVLSKRFRDGESLKKEYNRSSPLSCWLKSSIFAKVGLIGAFTVIRKDVSEVFPVHYKVGICQFGWYRVEIITLRPLHKRDEGFF